MANLSERVMSLSGPDLEVDETLTPILEVITKLTYGDLRELAQRIHDQLPYEAGRDQVLTTLWEVAQGHMDNLLAREASNAE